MKIVIKNYIFIRVAYDDQKKVICKIKNHPFGKRRNYIYDSGNRLRYITDINSKKNSIQNMDFHSYQIIEQISGTKKVVGTAEMSYIETTEGDSEKQFCFRPPFINKLMIYFKTSDNMITIHLNRNGSSCIKDREGKIVGDINKKIQKAYLTWYNNETIDICLLCAIYVLTSYLYAENDYMIV